MHGGGVRMCANKCIVQAACTCANVRQVCCDVDSVLAIIPGHERGMFCDVITCNRVLSMKITCSAQ